MPETVRSLKWNTAGVGGFGSGVKTAGLPGIEGIIFPGIGSPPPEGKVIFPCVISEYSSSVNSYVENIKLPLVGSTFEFEHSKCTTAYFVWNKLAAFNVKCTRNFFRWVIIRYERGYVNI